MIETRETSRPVEPALEEQLHGVLPSQFRKEWKVSREHEMMAAAALVLRRHNLEGEWLKEYTAIRGKR